MILQYPTIMCVCVCVCVRTSFKIPESLTSSFLCKLLLGLVSNINDRKLEREYVDWDLKNRDLNQDILKVPFIFHDWFGGLRYFHVCREISEARQFTGLWTLIHNWVRYMITFTGTLLSENIKRVPLVFLCCSWKINPPMLASAHCKNL